jgi:type IV pilus assembly protein PilV
MRRCLRRAPQRGALLMEVLVAILLCAFGLLGFVALQARATSAEFESYQRSQALVLVEDMVSRLNANRANAGDYVSDQLLGEGAMADCTGLSGADLDLCEWTNLVRGSAEQRSGSAVGSMIAARGCIRRVPGTTDHFVVAIAWQGMVPTGAPSSPCGKDDPTFPNENLRRVVAVPVCVALLRDPATPPLTPRC